MGITEHGATLATMTWVIAGFYPPLDAHGRGRFLALPRMKTIGSVAITIVFMFAAAFLGFVPVMLLLDGPSLLAKPLGGLFTALIAILLVYGRRRLTGRSWAGVGLRPSWPALAQALLGIAAGLTAVAAANGLSVAVGAARWAVWDDQGISPLYAVPVALLLPLLNQAFPEELLWRGDLYGRLSETMSRGRVLLITSVVFGLLHIVSQSQAESLGERMLYILQAVALGFACGAARERTGALWAAVGVHWGLHLAGRFFFTEAVDYPVQLLLMTATLTLAGLLFLRGPASNPTRRLSPPHPSRSSGS